MHAKKEGNLEEVEVIEQNEETCPPLDSEAIGRKCTLMAEMLKILEEEC
jgi:hypothetical protein